MVLAFEDGMARTGLSTVDDWPRPDVYDVDLARRVARVHCPVMQYPTTKRCLNCGWGFPCATYRWAVTVLRASGWTEEQIDGLDERIGAWS